MPLRHLTLSLGEARQALAAAEAEAKALGVNAAIVMLDAGGALVTALRMDAAWPGAMDLAMAKAQAAHGFAAPSGAFFPMVQPGQPLFGVGTVAGGRYLTLPGGLPLVGEGLVVGAIGVSGGAVDQDEAVATRGQKAFLDTLEV